MITEVPKNQAVIDVTRTFYGWVQKNEKRVSETAKKQNMNTDDFLITLLEDALSAWNNEI